jgi:hypothetical protein
MNRFKSNCQQAFIGITTKEIVYISNPNELWLEVAYYPIYKYHEIVYCACYFYDVTARPISTNEIAEIKTLLSHQIATLPHLLKAEENKKIEFLLNNSL